MTFDFLPWVQNRCEAGGPVVYDAGYMDVPAAAALEDVQCYLIHNSTECWEHHPPCTWNWDRCVQQSA